ncbi:RloB family protein [Pseudomonas ogarae]|uniref:RloB family protein n=1 Tax=Pseudomonas ogarae (strain DSM 112162 / CECT 30235 / F113) TaxID=1114970 RepID=UPI00195173FA|nr:RloB family protein [Pseudomonas ogarae]
MGSDDLHHKRKAKQAKDLERRKAMRRRYDKVLIVCEGSKTEPLYFEELKDYYELDTANIKISGNCGSAPLSVVTHGEDLYKQELEECNEPFDRVYCVFDKDTHPSYLEALQKVTALKPQNTFYAVTSVPCFEVWLLLHFRYSAAPIISCGKKSAGDNALDELTRYMPNYKKGDSGTFLELFPRLEIAKTHAERLKAQCEATKTDNPTTSIFELVNYLQNIKTPPEAKQ